MPNEKWTDNPFISESRPMLAEPNCFKRRCVHFLGILRTNENDETGEWPFCEAYPDGIPEDIAYGNNKHLEPLEGDHGIQFEQAKR